MKIAAVIPHWNGAERLGRCLASLHAQKRPFDQIIVVDNGSTDGSGAAAQVHLSENRGFAVAVNRGVAEAANADWIAVLNNDVVLDPGWLEELLRAAGDYSMLTGRTLQAADPKLLDGAGDALSMGLAAARLGHGLPDGPAYSERSEVLAVCFAAALVRADVFRKVSGLDERFFAYLEDVDFCLRAQLAGHRALYVPDAVAYHEGGASTGGPLDPRVVQWITTNQLLLIRRYARGPLWPRILWTQTLWAGRMIRHGRLLAWMRGMIRGLTHSRGRKIEIETSRLLDLLRASEKQIYADRSADFFWQAYFELFGN